MRTRFLVTADSMMGPRFWTALAEVGGSIGDDFAVLCLLELHEPPYRNRPDLFSQVYGADHLYREYGLVSPPPTEQERLQKFLSHLEDRTGVLAIDLIQADRHLGRGLTPGGTRHPRSRLSEQASYWATAALIQAYVELFDTIFDKEETNVVLSAGIASLPGRVLHALAESRGILIRNLVWSRVANKWTWAIDTFESRYKLRELYSAALEGPRVGTTDGTTLDGYRDDVLYHQINEGPLTWLGSVAAIGREALREPKTLVAVSLRRRRRKPVDYRLWSNVSFVRRIRSEYLTYTSLVDPEWKQLRQHPYIFAPLQVEPEGSMSVYSPEFGHQAGMIDLVVKAAPAGTRVFVKEHIPAFGRRPRDFYDWLTDIPTVILVPPTVSGAALARGSLATVTVTGTAGFEAAVAGVPVVCFGRHNFYDIVDHVYTMKEFHGLRDVFRRMVDEHAAGHANRIRQGRALLQAVETSSVDLEDRGPRRGATLKARHVQELYTLLQATLGDPSERLSLS